MDHGFRPALVAPSGAAVKTADLFDEADGATPLDPDQAEGLIPTWVATRGDLNAAEQANIADAVAWAESRRGARDVVSLMTDESMRDLHKRMFGGVWKWAGTYRRRDTNIGVHWPHIPTQVRDLLADVVAQTKAPESLAWPADELAIRFHHRLVVIHAFPNGNGRHARLAADLLVEALGRPAFSWGARDLAQKGDARTAYLDALRGADKDEDLEPLVEFARS